VVGPGVQALHNNMHNLTHINYDQCLFLCVSGQWESFLQGMFVQRARVFLAGATNES